MQKFALPAAFLFVLAASPALAQNPACVAQLRLAHSISPEEQERFADLLSLRAPRFDLTSAKKVLASSQPQLAAAREGLAQGVQCLTIKGIHQHSDLNFWKPLRTAARAYVLDGEIKRCSGDMSAAVSAYLDAVELGVQIPPEGGLLSGLVGLACEAIGLRRVWIILPQLSPAECRAALARLKAIERHRTPLSVIYREETRIDLADFESHLLYSAFNEDAPNTAPPDPEIQKPQFQRFVADWAAWSDGPPRLDPRPKAPNAWVKAQTSMYTRSWWSFPRLLGQSQMLRVALALRAFYLETDRYPDKLADIPRDLLEFIPIDPFGHGESIHYRRDGDRYLLWSVGPDGIDNGGTPMKAPGSSPGTFGVKPGIPGDMVAGLNF